MADSNQDSYPGLSGIQDPHIRLAVRTAFDLIRKLQGSAAGPIEGTLDPDTRPRKLGTNDRGLLFHATDFDRVFMWTGSAWTDAPGAPRRFQQLLFPVGDPPEAGWAACDGSTVKASTPTGLTVAYRLPVVAPTNGLAAYLRL